MMRTRSLASAFAHRLPTQQASPISWSTPCSAVHESTRSRNHLWNSWRVRSRPFSTQWPILTRRAIPWPARTCRTFTTSWMSISMPCSIPGSRLSLSSRRAGIMNWRKRKDLSPTKVSYLMRWRGHIHLLILSFPSTPCSRFFRTTHMVLIPAGTPGGSQTLPLNSSRRFTKDTIIPPTHESIFTGTMILKNDYPL